MPPLRRRRRGSKAESTIYFTQALNAKQVRQLCVYAECSRSGCVAGPIWSHTQPAIDRALATLTTLCDCPARFHSARFFEGVRVVHLASGKPRRAQ